MKRGVSTEAFLPLTKNLAFFVLALTTVNSLSFLPTTTAVMQSVTTSTTSLTPSSFTLVGRSRANDGTCFIIPQLNWMFDCGAILGSHKSPSHVFLTHTHSDHISNLAGIAWSATPTTTIYLPASALPYVDRYLKAHYELTTLEPIVEAEFTPPYTLVPCRPGDSISIPHKGKQYTVEIVECDHRVECIGYSITYQEQRLLPQYQSLEKAALKDLFQTYRKEGRSMEELKETVTTPLLCFLGDTTHKLFDNHPEIFQTHHTIVIECTFFEPGHLEKAEEYKHMHWSYLLPMIERYPETRFLIIHTSLRYKEAYIRDTLAPYNNVQLILPDERYSGGG
jgi:ribonuclease Z